jgi:hypothetical protein
MCDLEKGTYRKIEVHTDTRNSDLLEQMRRYNWIDWIIE